MEKKKNIGIDIGGSVIKIVYFGKICKSLPEYVTSEYEPGVFDQKHHLLKIPNQHFGEFLLFLKQSWLPNVDPNETTIRITGGGAFKWQTQIEQELGLSYQKVGEMECLVHGFDYVTHVVKDAIFTCGWRDKEERLVHIDNPYPSLLVNIGSGVSILRLDGPDKFTRISGSSLGGGTLMGIARLATGITNFEDIIKICEEGDNKNVDLLVGDIYGKNYDTLDLPPYVIASNFGKVATDPDLVPKQGDIVRSLIYMISDNITQIAYMNATMNSLGSPVKHIFFSGSFMALGPTLWKKLSYGVEFWSGAKADAKFLRHSGYLGAIGSLLAN